MLTRLRQVAGRRPLLFGIGLTFALTWPVDLALATKSHDKLPFHLPELIGFSVGYGFFVAALFASWAAGGWREVRALLRRYLIWHVGLVWIVVALFTRPALILAALALDVLLGGPRPHFAQPFVRNFIPENLSLWLVAPV